MHVVSWLMTHTAQASCSYAGSWQAVSWAQAHGAVVLQLAFSTESCCNL